jgi:AraC-like DNA-binding protein
MFVPRRLLILRPLPAATADTTAARIREHQRRLPYVRICLWLDLTPRDTLTAMTHRAHDHSVRGIIREPIVRANTLRDQMSVPTYFPRDLLYRLRLVGWPISSVTGTFLQTACERAAECASLSAVLDAAKASYCRLHRELAGTGIGTARQIHQIARLLVAAIEMQRERKRTMFDMATRYGYYDDAALRARLRDVFGTTASDIRQTIGWEWLLGLAMRRAGIRTPSRGCDR